jgi:hypothetical protein
MGSRAYSYIDLKSDEAVGKRRLLTAREGYTVSITRPAPDRPYKYIDEGDLPSDAT